ncbi:hypothetical protein [Marivirga harenae]|uniref:hypothetical protein n=1 Tax=Marivirga harenae TaxID=2010992 RepID=UPI0026DEFC80|nr:hypothetical protein [Marivirga harenae]WKV11009.1 hypothetical protein Q3Y49_12380 [Marivirga harenae]
MRNIVIIVLAVIFFGCNSKQEELPTKKFIDSVFLLEQTANSTWQPRVNKGILRTEKFYDFVYSNELALSYLQWNLFFEKLPDSIKYSTKSRDNVHLDFQNFANQDEEIKRAIQLLIYPEKFKDQYQINIDSLTNLSSKLYYASSAGEGRVGWSFCTGKSKFPEIYGETKSYESVILQALCFQALFEEKYSNPKKTVWSYFNRKIPEVSTEMKSIEYDDYIDKANQLMWEKISKSEELRDLLVGFTANESSKLYCQVNSN